MSVFWVLFVCMSLTVCDLKYQINKTCCLTECLVTCVYMYLQTDLVCVPVYGIKLLTNNKCLLNFLYFSYLWFLFRINFVKIASQQTEYKGLCTIKCG